jgi:predicted RNA-binding Zn-ribbon protein involved in translation (DUF1610 family)
VQPQVQYRVCPTCARAVPISSTEYHCINDGTKLLESCPRCQASIHSPYALHCGKCGFEFSTPYTALEPIPSATKSRGLWLKAALIGATCMIVLIGVLNLPKASIPEIKTVFIGRIPNSDALIAIATKERRVLAYVCDGKKISEWFKGVVNEDNSLELQSKSGASLIVQINPKSAQGTLELSSGNYVFSALPTRGKAAFYRSEGANRVAGWVILPNGTTKSAIGVNQKIVAAPEINTPNTVMQLKQLNLKPALQINPNLPNGYPF